MRQWTWWNCTGLLYQQYCGVYITPLTLARRWQHLPQCTENPVVSAEIKKTQLGVISVCRVDWFNRRYAGQLHCPNVLLCSVCFKAFCSTWCTAEVSWLCEHVNSRGAKEKDKARGCNRAPVARRSLSTRSRKPSRKAEAGSKARLCRCKRFPSALNEFQQGCPLHSRVYLASKSAAKCYDVKFK